MARTGRPRSESPLCPRGHNKDITGRLWNRGCRQCVNDRSKAKRLARNGYSGHRKGRSKEEIRIARRQYVKSLHAWVDDIKLKAGCKDCGYNQEAIALEFDHLGNKVANISSMVNDGRSQENIALEMLKCDIICTNCHRVRTRNRLVRK